MNACASWSAVSDSATAIDTGWISSLALGATQWQTIWRQVLPAAIPGIATGVILALSRAIGETAPLIVVGAAAFVAFNPRGPLDAFTALRDRLDPDRMFRNRYLDRVLGE